MNRLLPVLLIFLHSTLSFSQVDRSLSSSEILLSMKKLNVLGSVLYVAAHPDDENTRLITYFSKDRLYRTGYLSVTRGDGGQNLIGDEQGIELGLIRTQELLAARRVDGGQQFFTRAYDFGYSKNPEETFSKWDKNKIMSDVVWVIRKFRPDVIVTRFPVTGEGGHGHHTASAILANEAFIAAGDSSFFPEQLKFVDVWKPKRIVWNTFNFGGRNLTSEDQLKLDVGGFNALIGRSYGEIAADSRSQHKSQGFGSASSRGEYFEFFKHSGGTEAKKDLMEDVVQDWKRIKGGEKIQAQVNKLVAAFNPSQPQHSLPALAALHKSIGALKNSFWKAEKLKEVEQLLIQCSGLFMDAYTNTQYAVISDSLQINLNVVNRLGGNVTLKGITIPSWASYDPLNRKLVKNSSFDLKKMVLVNKFSALAQPYWLAEEKSEGAYTVSDIHKIGQPDADPAKTVLFKVNIEGIDIDFVRSVRYKHTDPVKGEIYQPLVILPKFLLDAEQQLFISKGNDSLRAGMTLTNTARNTELPAASIVSTGTHPFLKISPTSFSLTERNKAHDVSISLPPVSQGEYDFLITSTNSAFDSTSEEPARKIREISYDHIPLIHYFERTKISVLNLDLKIEGKNVGYIPGAGDKVPEALQEMGYNVVLLNEKELARNNLSQFDAIITGIRAYNTNDWLPQYYDRLMSYVEQGGNFIVQYNTNSNAGPLRSRIGPYAFDISRTRVTDENAGVNFLRPDHRVLNFPNKITSSDFEEWIQERSIYHAANWNKDKYETIISMSDPNETADEGSLIIAKHGQGNFVYTGLVFFRQLPAGVKGAYRLFANLIAL